MLDVELNIVPPSLRLLTLDGTKVPTDVVLYVFSSTLDRRTEYPARYNEHYNTA